MSAPSPDILGIIKRYFQAIEILQNEEIVHSISEFCLVNDLEPSRIYQLKNNIVGKKSRSKNLYDKDFLILADKYNFSLEWIFFGTGKVRSSRKSNIPTKKCKPRVVEIVKIGYRNA